MPQVVIGEVAYLVDSLVGPQAEAAFLRRLADGALSLHPLDPSDLQRMAEIVETYADLRIVAVDAAVVAMAERLGVSRIATLDHRHFAVVRPAHVAHFELLP